VSAFIDFAVTCFSVATACFFSFGSPFLTVFRLLYHLATFLLQKQDSPMPPNSVAKSAHPDHHRRLCGRFFANGYTNINPHLLWRQSRPPTIIWASAGCLRKCTARSYPTPCTSSPPTTRLLRGRHKLCHRSGYGDT
jgi:hypothetical protein